MWAFIDDGSITKIIKNPKAMLIGGTQYSRNIFSFRWSNEEREAKGIYEVVQDNTNKKDEHWYTNTNVSYAFADGVVLHLMEVQQPKLMRILYSLQMMKIMDSVLKVKLKLKD